MEFFTARVDVIDKAQFKLTSMANGTYNIVSAMRLYYDQFGTYNIVSAMRRDLVPVWYL